MNIKKFIAIILTTVICIMCIPVTASAATTTDLGYKIVKSIDGVELSDPWNLYDKITFPSKGRSSIRHSCAIISPVPNLSNFGFLKDGEIVNNWDFEENPMYIWSNENAKCYFKSAAEKTWHRYKSHVEIMKHGSYQVKYVWEDKKGTKKEEIINFTIHNWCSAEIYCDYRLVDEKSVTLHIVGGDTPSNAKYYYTTDGSKPTTKSKQIKMNYYNHSKNFTFTKSCTFRVLIKCKGYEDTYMTVPIGIGKDYTNTLNWDKLENGAFCSAATCVSQTPVRFEFCRGYDDDYKFYYTMDGTKPTTKSTEVKYKSVPVDITESCTIRVLTIDKNGNKQYSRFRYIIDNTQSMELAHLY